MKIGGVGIPELIYILFVLGISVALALIPAKIAKKKGYNFVGFLVFGFFFFLPALIVALVITDKSKYPGVDVSYVNYNQPPSGGYFSGNQAPGAGYPNQNPTQGAGYPNQAPPPSGSSPSQTPPPGGSYPSQTPSSGSAYLDGKPIPNTSYPNQNSPTNNDSPIEYL